MMIQRQTHDIELYRNDDLYIELTVLDEDDDEVDISDYSFAAQIRAHTDGPILAELTVSLGTDPTAGEITVFCDGASIDVDLGPDDVGAWDLECISDAATPIETTAFAGAVTLVKDVTLDDD